MRLAEFFLSGNERFHFQREDSNSAKEAKTGPSAAGKDQQKVLHGWMLSLLPVPLDQLLLLVALHNQHRHSQSGFVRLWWEWWRGVDGSFVERIQSYRVPRINAGLA